MIRMRRGLSAWAVRAGGARAAWLASRYLGVRDGRPVLRREPVFQVLAYHRVNDQGDPFFPALPVAAFEQHVAAVARVATVLTVAELVERSRRGSLPGNAVAITFDDGYRDTLTHAAPVLARHGLPATVFLATGFIGTADVPWFDRLAGALKTARISAVETPWGETLDLETPRARLDGLDRLLRRLKRVPDEERRRGVDRVLDALGVPDYAAAKNDMLNWDEVLALAGLGFSIGAHTVSHPILSRVSLASARAEIQGSRAMIEEAMGRRPRAFAYPNGGPDDYTAAVAHLVREAGFACAVTTRFGINTPATPVYELRRGGPWEHDGALFRLKLAWYRMTG